MARLLANIWVAAGDGDLDRVRRTNASFRKSRSMLVQIDNQNLHLALSPNVPDEFTYTPIHAAASYGHIHVLEYLLSRGGNVNITDNDGDTPLYTVENIETARWLIQHGAAVGHQNSEGVSPADHLTDEFPQIAEYLRSIDSSRLASSHSVATSASTTSSTSTSLPSNSSSSNPTATSTSTVASWDAAPIPIHMPSQHAQNVATEQLTAALMASVQEIMQRAEAEGRDPDEELRELVSRTVLEGVVTGYGMGAEAREGGQGQEEGRRGPTDDIDSPAKRSRME
ncbi:unnamed protein product [Cyclocybe aegerita]|uniref:Ankyrin n=1 Tax=Cyclocybe aegerita TaxID=1973307 RepID=A0A8S0WP55_CYCAE|nr:unnamed protein product [Cyclocybe aegerita]